MSVAMKIGDKIHLGSYKLFIRDDEEAQITLKLPDSEIPLNIKIQFASNEDEPDKRRLEVTGDGQDALVIFTNWNSGLGVITQKHVNFAQSQDGDEVSFLASVRKGGKVRELDIQFLLKSVDSAEPELASQGEEQQG